jgi:hypothetical protein
MKAAILYREPLETPVGFPEVPRRKLLILYYITNYENAIFSRGFAPVLYQNGAQNACFKVVCP